MSPYIFISDQVLLCWWEADFYKCLKQWKIQWQIYYSYIYIYGLVCVCVYTYLYLCKHSPSVDFICVSTSIPDFMLFPLTKYIYILIKSKFYWHLPCHSPHDKFLCSFLSASLQPKLYIVQTNWHSVQQSVSDGKPGFPLCLPPSQLVRCPWRHRLLQDTLAGLSIFALLAREAYAVIQLVV